MMNKVISSQTFPPNTEELYSLFSDGQLMKFVTTSV